jgi:hypothetical protein
MRRSTAPSNAPIRLIVMSTVSCAPGASTSSFGSATTVKR